MAVRISGPGSPLERYKGKPSVADGQPEAPVQRPNNSPNPYSRVVEAGKLGSLSLSYTAAEAAIVRLGRGLVGGGITSGAAGRERLSSGLVFRLLSVDEEDVVSDSVVADDAIVSKNGKGGETANGEEGASLVAERVSQHIRASREQALGSHI